MTVLIDTNVILDFVLRREPFAQSAHRVLSALFADKAKVCLTASTITDIYYLIKRTLRDTAAAKDAVAKLLHAFHIADVTKADCLDALDAKMDDYEDALLSICAKKVKATRILTRNTRHFTASPVPATAPDDFLSEFYPFSE